MFLSLRYFKMRLCNNIPCIGPHVAVILMVILITIIIINGTVRYGTVRFGTVPVLYINMEPIHKSNNVYYYEFISLKWQGFPTLAHLV